MYFNPDYATDSVEFLEEILESRNISFKKLSKLTKIPEETLRKIMNRKIPMTYGYSFLISEALDIEHDIILNMDLHYKKFMENKKTKN